jgi:hypothetical protein
MGELLRRRAMMQAASEDEGIVFSQYPHSVKVKNGRSGTIYNAYRVSLISYNGTDALGCSESFGSISANATKTLSNLATDGIHIWLSMQSCTTVKYNDSTIPFTRSGTNFQIEMPADFDPTVPLVFS